VRKGSAFPSKLLFIFGGYAANQRHSRETKHRGTVSHRLTAHQGGTAAAYKELASKSLGGPFK